MGSDHFQKKNIINYKIDLPEIFFLYVGSREGYKNFKLLVKAVSLSNNLNKIKIVCFGGGKFSQAEINKYNLNNNFINLQGDDNLLAYLYTKALALVNTSKYEGFGITNVEAMNLVAPVVSSNFETLLKLGRRFLFIF